MQASELLSCRASGRHHGRGLFQIENATATPEEVLRWLTGSIALRYVHRLYMFDASTPPAESQVRLAWHHSNHCKSRRWILTCVMCMELCKSPRWILMCVLCMIQLESKPARIVQEELIAALVKLGAPAGAIRLQCSPRSFEQQLVELLPPEFELHPVQFSYVLVGHSVALCPIRVHLNAATFASFCNAAVQSVAC